jgi:hypothetical protein
MLAADRWNTGPLGPMLSADELGTDKLLLDRAQARDFVDVAALVNRFGLEQLGELASEKDPGFSRSVLVEMLGSFGRFRPDEFGLQRSADDELARLSSRRANSCRPADGPPLPMGGRVPIRVTNSGE